jgi:hypothetical protein
MNWLSWAGRTVTGRHAERQTSTFTEPVRRAEVRMPAGAVSFAPADGPARVHRTVRWALARPVTAERVDMADDPSPPRQLIAHSGAGRVSIRRH